MEKHNPVLSLPLATALAAISSLMPLTCYVLSLSAFGIPHVYYELHYIRERFSSRLSLPFKSGILLVLTMICLCNTAALIMPFQHVMEIVLLIAALLFLLAYFFAPSLMTLAGIFLFTAGILFNPVLVFFIMAFLHNLTPWGFLKERGASGRAWIIFILLPVVVFFLSMPTALDHALYSPADAETFLAHYIPVKWQDIDFVKPVFAAAVYLQLTHYDTTIRVMPKLMSQGIRPHRLVYVVFALVCCAFIFSFKTSRSVYSILAGFHAWLEVPILLAVFAGYFEPESRAAASAS
ncbi:hypothetical protein AQUSIP_08820 [Aquicella siphonis]|uniref:Uncharacterized protein n=1 Tax=Aquicella siphonis TaxID=254247 RepID=A0A5E4PGI7_9COXI|nr:hypothetical protein [Aquicella siphonis]VVC75592.1 hypothetical protein AQUSIP_08820 [Aquicella siphonis]